MKIGASLVLLVAPTVIACAAAVPVGVGRAYRNAHTTNGVFRKRASPLRSNGRNLRISGCASNFDRAQTPGSSAHVLLTARFAGRHPAKACERHHRDLAPKWLDPRQGRMRGGCTLQHRVEAGVFASRQQSRSEGALRAASPAPILPSLIGNGRVAIFMNRDVVEIAQAILHAFQPREELLPTLRRLLAREKVGEELRCVSHLLGLNAQLMTAAGVEPGERSALLADLLEAARQLVGSGNFDGDVTTIADEVVLRSPPLPRFQPAGNLERQCTKPLRPCRILRARERRRALLREVARET